MRRGLDHDGACFRAIGLVGSAHVHGQECALAVHGDMTRAALDLLAATQTTRFACRRGFDGLAVQDRVARGTSTPPQSDLAPAGTEHRHRLRPDATLLPASPVGVDRVPRRKVVWHARQR